MLNMTHSGKLYNTIWQYQHTMRGSTVMQGMSVKYSSALDCLRKIWHEEGGIFGLYKGAGAGVLRTVSGHAMFGHLMQTWLASGPTDASIKAQLFVMEHLFYTPPYPTALHQLYPPVLCRYLGQPSSLLHLTSSRHPLRS
jgi:hypothetical protein